MYSCRKFLGLFLTGLFLSGMFASSDFSMNNPKELNQNDKIKSIVPAVDSKEARVLPTVKTDIDSMVKAKYLASQEAAVKALPNASEKQPSNRDCTDCVYDWTQYGSECCDSAWDEFAIDCATLTANYGWDCTGCLCPGDLTCEEQGLVDCPEGSAEACAATLEDCTEDPNADCTGNTAWIADGYCDTGNNNEACAWDGGDCCGSTCVDSTYECGTDASSWSACNSECLDPSANDDCCADFSCDFYAIVCGDGTCDGGEDYYTCPEDCNAPGECDPGFVIDCVDTDCCPESWIGDGFADCEDQQYGCDLTCYDNDGGDCAGGTTTTTTTTGGTAACEDCVYDFTAYGSECCDTAWTEYGIDCATLEANYSWDCTGCACPGDGPAVCGDGACTGDEDYYTCPEDCNAPGVCDPGFVVDCVDTDCCPESWIGDGFADCEDQQYGCDLTCYDNDGGDCAGGTTTGTTTGGGSPDCDDCVYDWTNYGSECCDTAWTEFGIDCATLSANYGWDCAGCECPGDTTVVDCEANWDACVASLLYIGSEYYEACSQENCDGGPGGACDGLVVPGLTAECGFAASNIANGNCPDPCGNGRSEEARKLPVKTKEGSAYSTTSATFIGDTNSGTRDDIYVVGLSCDACVTGGPWSGSFNGTPELGEFTVYGFDPNSAVSVTLQSCTTAGACSDVVEVGTVIAGDTTSQECAEGGGDGCDQAAGDSNNDGTVNVLDVVGIVNHILAGGNGLEGCDLEVADYNGDETVNVLDVVAIVNLILAGGGRTADATDAIINTTSNSVSISANGYIGGVQMTLSHGADFSINLTDNAYVAEYITNGNSTTLIVINPEDDVIFTSTGNFDVEEVLVTNSEEFINVVDASLEFSLSNAYPNPFNPTTTIELNIAEASYASVKVFNLKGEVVGVLMDGMVDANAYTMTWDASNFASGVYMIRAEAGGQIATQKVMLVK